MTATSESPVRVEGAPASQPRRRRKERKPWTPRDKRQLRLGLLFISPWLIGVTAFVIYPLVYSFFISLTRYSGMQTPEWVGFGNYVAVFQDPLARISVWNTLFYAGIAVPLGLVVALILALAMNRNVREVALYRTALYVPSLVPAFAMAFIFIVFVNPQYGLFNRFLGLFGGQNVDLLGDPTTAKLVIILIAQLGAGNAALIYLAGLRNIPVTLYEAARVDGASKWRQFRSITLPLLSPVILFNLITGISGALQIFTEAFIMTDGGPDNGTLFYMLYLYRNAFTFGQLGFASAMAVLLFLVGIALAGLVWYLFRKFVHYDTSAG